MSRPRIVFMGTPDFAVKSLEACLELGEVLAVVTQPDKPKGRGQEVTVSPVKALALSKGLTVLQPPRLKGAGFGEQLRRLAPDVAVVTAYGKILPPDVLQAPAQGCVNVHASLLPRWRGAAPIQRAIAAGDPVTGVTLMKLDEGMDTGPTFARAQVPIAPEETGASLHDTLASLGHRLLLDALPRFLAGELVPAPQPAQGATLAPMLEKEEGALDFSRSAVELERTVRAFTPWPGTFIFFSGSLLKVHRVQVGMGQGTPGDILSLGGAIEVACAEGSLRLMEVQPEGRRRMGATEFLAGRRLALGSAPFTKVQPESGEKR